MSQNFNVEHPWYQKREPIWIYNKDHYDGGRALVESSESVNYLPSFRVEDGDSYEARAKRAMGLYDNILKRAISVYTSQVFGVDPLRPGIEGGELSEMAKNVDLHGTNANPFFLNASAIVNSSSGR